MISKKKAQITQLLGKSIQQILDESYKILGNPILLFDTSYNYLAKTQNITTDDWVWNEIATTKTFSHETVMLFYEEKFFEAFAQSDVVAFMHSDKLKYDRFSGKIFDGAVQIANISIVSCKKPFEEGDEELIECICEVLSKALQNSDEQKQINRVYEKTIFDDLLEGSGSLPASTKAKLEQLDSQLHQNKFLAVVDISQCDTTVTHLAYYRDVFKKLQPEHHYFVYLNNIIIVLSSLEPVLNIKRDFNKLDDFFSQNNIFCGFSCAFSSIFQAKKYFKQAINAINYGLKSLRAAFIYKYDDFRFEHRLHTTLRVSEFEEMKNSTVLALQEYDEKHQTNLIGTLHFYLAFGMDKNLASQAMKVSLEKFRQNLNILEENFDVDWKNGDQLTNIYVHLGLLNSYEKTI